MDLYIIRHAEAIELGEQGITEDAQRPLTPKGEKQAQAVGHALRRLDIPLDKILTSPLLRARQTTDHLLGKLQGQSPEVVVFDDLVPEVRLKYLVKSLRRVGGERIAVVGHNPQLMYFLRWLLGSKKVEIELAKAGVALLHFDDAPGKGLGTLEWLVTPAWFLD